MTNYEQAAAMFGEPCYITDDYEVRAIEKDDGMHVFVFRVLDGKTQLPLGFFGGHNHLFFPKREVK